MYQLDVIAFITAMFINALVWSCIVGYALVFRHKPLRKFIPKGLVIFLVLFTWFSQLALNNLIIKNFINYWNESQASVSEKDKK